MRRLLLPALLAALLASAPPPASAEPVGDSFAAWPASARAEGMGGAFAAVAEGALGAFANPAGLGFRERPEVASTRRALDLERSVESTALRFDMLPRGDTALGYRKMATENMIALDATGAAVGGFDHREEIISLSQGISFGERLAMGATLYGTRDELAAANATGRGADLGLLLRGRDVSLGLVAKHLAHRRDWRGTLTNPRESYAREYVAGAAFRHGRHTLAVDVESGEADERRYRGGVESKVTERVALRAGLDDGRAAWGLGLLGSGFRVDCGYTNGATLGDTYAATVTFFDPLERLRRRDPRAAALPSGSAETAPLPVGTPDGGSGDPSGGTAVVTEKALSGDAVINAAAPAPRPPAVTAGRFAEGRRLFLAGRYAEAVPPLAETVEADPRRADAACLLGVALAKAGRAEEARPILETALAIDPANPYAKYADVYLR